MASPTVPFCSESWIIIISYLANVKARSAELAIKADGLYNCIFNALHTPDIITPEFLADVLKAQENIETELKVNIGIEEALEQAVVKATAAYQAADKT